MRRLFALITLLALQCGALVALPTLTSATATPRPVEASLQQLPLSAAPATDVRRAAGVATSVLSPMRRTTSFSAMGVTWRPDPAVAEVEIAFRHRSSGRWSAWESIEAEGDDAPDNGSIDTTKGLRAGSPPIWTGPSDGVQVRVTPHDGGATPRDVKIELVDPGTSPADTLSSGPRDQAGALEPQPTIVTRAQWGADESIRRGSPSYTGPARVGFVHHTASSNSYTADQAAQMVRGIYAYHVKSNGWSDIGYNFLVDRFGRTYEGRAGGIDRWVSGAHTGGFNANSFGVSLLGDFSTIPPSPATIAALSKVLAHKLGAAYRDPLAKATLTSAGGGTSRYSAGATATFDVVSGHRDAGNTSCPGATTYAMLPEIRRMVSADLGAGFADTSVSRTSFALADKGPMTLKARTLGDTSWTATVTGPDGEQLAAASGAPGPVSLDWNLTRADGRAVPPGRYALRLTGRDGDEAALEYGRYIVVRAPSCRGTPMQKALCSVQKRAAARTTG